MAGSSPTSATIYDFDCIYSYDIQRKRQKRWHDGFLRFHVFNRRVMVYDVPRNFIGDMHLKGADELQDGDELQLDRGVLVEVGQSRGSAKQDVTPLFERKRVQAEERQAASRPPPRGFTSAMSTLASSPATEEGMLRPKSLNVVLGPRKGLQGRAVLPKQSPFDRVNRVEATVEEPPKKRPRIETAPRLPNAHNRSNDRMQETLSASVQPQRHSNRSEPSTDKDLATSTNREMDISPPRTTEENLGPGRTRPVSRLKPASTKRSKLMFLSTSQKPPEDTPAASPSKSTNDRQDVDLEQSPTPLTSARRAPLRVAAFEDPPSSPPGNNMTVMAFPTSQNVSASAPRPDPTLHAAEKTLSELDAELMALAEVEELKEAELQDRAVAAQAQPAEPSSELTRGESSAMNHAQGSNAMQTVVQEPPPVPPPALAEPAEREQLEPSRSRTEAKQTRPASLQKSFSNPVPYPAPAAPPALPEKPTSRPTTAPSSPSKVSKHQKPQPPEPYPQRAQPQQIAVATETPSARIPATDTKSSSIPTVTTASKPVSNPIHGPVFKPPSKTGKPKAKAPVQATGPSKATLQAPVPATKTAPLAANSTTISTTTSNNTTTTNATGTTTTAQNTSTNRSTSTNPTSNDANATADADMGPWSRTAFDLFGFVRPSSMPTAADVAGQKKLEALKKRCRGLRGSTRGMMCEYWD